MKTWASRMILLIVPSIIVLLGQTLQAKSQLDYSEFQQRLHHVSAQDPWNQQCLPSSPLMEDGGQRYDPVLASIAASVIARWPLRRDKWVAHELLPTDRKMDSVCSGSLRAHVHLSTSGSRQTVIIFPGSHAQFKRGGYINRTVQLLREQFQEDLNFIAFSGFQSGEFLSGRCREVLWNPLNVGEDLFYRLKPLLSSWLGMRAQKIDIVGFSGGGAMTLGFLKANSEDRQRGSGFNIRSASLWSPILNGPRAFSLLDQQINKYTTQDRLSPQAQLDYLTRIGGPLATAFVLQSERGLVSALETIRTRRSSELQRRFAGEFSYLLQQTQKASQTGGSNSSTYFDYYVVNGFAKDMKKRGQIYPDVPTLIEAFNDTTNVIKYFNAIQETKILIVAPSDDPVLNRLPDDIHDLNPDHELIEKLKNNPMVYFYQPCRGGHTAHLMHSHAGQMMRAVMAD